jgi:hypothetical protein
MPIRARLGVEQRFLLVGELGREVAHKGRAVQSNFPVLEDRENLEKGCDVARRTE